MVQPRPGMFTDRWLVLTDLPRELRDLPTWVDFHAEKLDQSVLQGLRTVAAEAQDLLDEDGLVSLVHGDLNARDRLVDPVTLAVTAVLDWEFTHSGSPYADLGNLLRFERQQVFTDAVLGAYRAFMPSTRDDLVYRARAADLFALVELAARGLENEAVVRSRAQLAAIARTGDLHARSG